ncbi:Spore germination protein A2 [bioreactor metagenome]|uniref:Spore germination protein A2 n=1 Tax=bioreactor metagenome TaxID=1076179 RepID=A0A644UDY7_9ZZZZ|nr:endospore germination permease [Negativicutes bacterium]
MKMADLEAKHTITPYQLTAIIIATVFGGQVVLAPRAIIEKAETGTMVALLLGGLIFFGIALMAIKLGEQYPKETLVDYMPRLWGQKVGGLIVWWFAAVFLIQFSIILNGFGKVITLFMFDRTPNQVIQIGILALTVYCAMQDFGTILRVLQITLLVSSIALFFIWSTALLNLNPDNLLPFMSSGVSEGLSTVFDMWGMYSGYEIILLILPLVLRSRTGLTKNVTWAFVILILMFEWLFIVIIGVATAKSAGNIPYPTIIAMRSVELPGTFIERLENYLLLAWVPTVFDSLVIALYGSAQVIARRYGYADHRPVVLLLAPVLFGGSLIMLYAITALETANKLTNWVGLGFSLVIIPISLMLAWRQKRGINSATEKS